jgi:hypothetical protein
MSDVHAQEPTSAAEPGKEPDKDGFGAAFRERAANPGGQAPEPQQDGAAPSDKEPAPAGSTEAPAGAGAEGTTSGTEATALDPWADLKPEQKSYFERLRDSERSQRGRVGALTRKLQGMAAPKAPETAPEEKPAKQATDTDSKTGEDGKADSVSDLDKRLQAAVDEYGDVVGPIAEVLKDVRSEIAALKGTVSTVEVEKDAQKLTEAYKALETVHPDYLAISEDQNFAAWLGDQPKQVIDLANSFDPREVSLALTLFKTERSAAIASQTGEGGDKGDKGSTATDTKRQRQLEGSRSVPSKGGTAVAQVPNDFSLAFKARVAQQKQERP